MKLFILLAACLSLAQAKKCERFTSDFVIALDNSNAIQNDNQFSKMKCRAKDIISRLEIGPRPGQSLVAVSTFGAKPIACFGKTKYIHNSALVNAVHKLRYDGKTKPNLFTATDRMQTLLNGNNRRKDAIMLYIYILSGKHNANNEQKLNRSIFREITSRQGIKMLGISTVLDEGYDDNIYNLIPYSGRRSKLNEKYIHGQIQRFIVKNCLDCYQPTIDMVFLIPNFGAFGSPRFDTMKKYIQDLLAMFTVGNADHKVRVAVATFDTTARTIFGLDTYTTIGDLQNNIGAIDFDRSKQINNFGSSVHNAVQHGLTVLSNARSGATKMLVSFGHIDYRGKTDHYKTIRLTNSKQTYLHHVRFVNINKPDPDLRWNSHDLCLDGQFPHFR